MALSKSQEGFAPIFIAIFAAVIIAAGAGGYLVFNSLNQPVRIKEKSTVIQPLFQDLKRSIEDVAEHIDESPSGSDSDSHERYAQKGSSLIKTGNDNLDKLRAQITKLDLPEVQDYKKNLSDYIAKSEELIKYEKDNVKLGQDYDAPRRDYEQLTKDISGVSSYMYSDPARYVKEVGEAISKEDKVIKAFEGLSEEGLFKKYHEVFIKTLKTERDFLAEVSEAVNNRDDNALKQAIKGYDQASKDEARELSRISDEAKEKYKGVISELKSLADRVDQSYNVLKDKFKF
ncbi:hypothetical protein HYU95_03435 [Candidatus Daviesbacteria bacterium]|nr:hypothetical protein [Candidatus Daviesbacteria bacterium]